MDRKTEQTGGLYYDLKKKLICGLASGFFTGLIFGLPEYMKIVRQLPINQMSLRNNMKQPKFFTNMVKGIVSFPILVAFVAAAQFTVNDQIRKGLGDFAGIIASAVSGATFLTVGDHYMLRQKLFNSNFIESSKYFMNQRAFFIGFKAITIRQAIFMTNVCYAGPYLGRIIKRLFETPAQNPIVDTKIDHKWNFIGRTIMGIIATYLSQPFDVSSRRQQITFNNKNQKEGLLDVISSLKDAYRKLNPKLRLKDFYRHPLTAGISYRLWLGTFGGAVIKGLYDLFEEKYQTQD